MQLFYHPLRWMSPVPGRLVLVVLPDLEYSWWHWIDPEVHISHATGGEECFFLWSSCICQVVPARQCSLTIHIFSFSEVQRWASSLQGPTTPTYVHPRQECNIQTAFKPCVRSIFMLHLPLSCCTLCTSLLQHQVSGLTVIIWSQQDPWWANLYYKLVHLPTSNIN